MLILTTRKLKMLLSTTNAFTRFYNIVFALLQLQKMKEKKGLYPDKSVYTQQVGPGFCFGALALMLRFYFEVKYECAALKWLLQLEEHSLSEKQVCVTALMTCSFTPAGMGLRLCPQFLPCVTGCVLHSAAAQEEPLRRDGTQCSQTQLLHPLLLCMMHLFI